MFSGVNGFWLRSKVFYNRCALRPSCYECLYATTERKTDLTIGDFWHIEETIPDFYDPNGNSLFLIHTNRGFNHVVFIIRKDIEKEFKEVIGDRIASICSSHNVTVDYAFQDINDIPGTLPEGRTKPWGTGQAVLAAKKVIKTPFIVINADDYYGKEGFKAVHEYLVNGGKSCFAWVHFSYRTSSTTQSAECSVD